MPVREKSFNENEFEQQLGWIVGWRSIMKYLGCINYKTLRKWEKKYSFPIYRTLSGRPMILPYIVDLWIVEYNKEIERIKKS